MRIAANIRRGGKKLICSGNNPLNVLRLQMRVECIVARPFLDERKIRRIGVVLHKLVCDAPFLGTRRFDQLRQCLFRLFDLVGFRSEVSDDSQRFHNLDDRRHDLANTSLQFTVIGYRRDDRDLGGVDRRYAFGDHLRRVDQEPRRHSFFQTVAA